MNSRTPTNLRTLKGRATLSGGFTFLEILLTATILLIGLTAVFHTTQSALQRIAAARELTEVQNACNSLLSELLVQAAPIRSDAGKTIPHLPHWKIRVDLYPAPQPRLYVLHLSAQQFSHSDGVLLGVKYHLVRWVPIERVWFPPPPHEMMDENEWGEW